MELARVNVQSHMKIVKQVKQPLVGSTVKILIAVIPSKYRLHNAKHLRVDLVKREAVGVVVVEEVVSEEVVVVTEEDSVDEAVAVVVVAEEVVVTGRNKEMVTGTAQVVIT